MKQRRTLFWIARGAPVSGARLRYPLAVVLAAAACLMLGRPAPAMLLCLAGLTFAPAIYARDAARNPPAPVLGID